MIEGRVVGISETMGQQFPVGAVRIDPGDPAARSQNPLHEAIAVPQTRQQLVLTPYPRRARGVEFGHFRLITDHHHQAFFIGR
jgi:hypothetical protein